MKKVEDVKVLYEMAYSDSNVFMYRLVHPDPPEEPESVRVTGKEDILLGGAMTNQEHELVLDVLQIPDAAFAVNASQRIVAWNSAAERLLGYPADEALGAHCYEILKPDRSVECDECRFHCVAFATSRRPRIMPSIETSIETSDGTRKWLALTTLAAHTAQGQMRVIHLIRDVTEYHRFQKTARRQESHESHEQGTGPHNKSAPRLKTPHRSTDASLLTTASDLTQTPHPPDHHAESGAVAHDLRVNRDMAEKAPPETPPMREQLTPREHEVLRLLACGMATDEIAQKLSISRVTARNHVNKVIEKLGVSSRLQAVVVAAQRNLL